MTKTHPFTLIFQKKIRHIFINIKFHIMSSHAFIILSNPWQNAYILRWYNHMLFHILFSIDCDFNEKHFTGPISCTFKQITDFYWNHLWPNPWRIKMFSPRSDQTTLKHTILSAIVYIKATKDISPMLWGWLYVQRHGGLICLDTIATEYFWRRNKLLVSIVTVDWSITACP